MTRLYYSEAADEAEKLAACRAAMLIAYRKHSEIREMPGEDVGLDARTIYLTLSRRGPSTSPSAEPSRQMATAAPVDSTADPRAKRSGIAYSIRGRTYKHKDVLKEMGCYWNGSEKAWVGNLEPSDVDRLKELGLECEPR